MADNIEDPQRMVEALSEENGTDLTVPRGAFEAADESARQAWRIAQEAAAERDRFQEEADGWRSENDRHRALYVAAVKEQDRLRVAVDALGAAMRGCPNCHDDWLRTLEQLDASGKVTGTADPGVDLLAGLYPSVAALGGERNRLKAVVESRGQRIEELVAERDGLREHRDRAVETLESMKSWVPADRDLLAENARLRAGIMTAEVHGELIVRMRESVWRDSEAKRDRLRAVVEHAVEALGAPTGPSRGVLMGTVSLLRAALDVSTKATDGRAVVEEGRRPAIIGPSAFEVLTAEYSRLRAVVEAVLPYTARLPLSVAVDIKMALTEEATLKAAVDALDVSADMGGRHVTKTGKVLTDADIEALADEAERGYDVSQVVPGARRVRDAGELWHCRCGSKYPRHRKTCPACGAPRLCPTCGDESSARDLIGRDPITADEIPQELIDILNRGAGKEHSRQGPVVRNLAEILTRFREINPVPDPLDRFRGLDWWKREDAGALIADAPAPNVGNTVRVVSSDAIYHGELGTVVAIYEDNPAARASGCPILEVELTDLAAVVNIPARAVQVLDAGGHR